MKSPQQGVPPAFEELLPEFQQFCEVVARLRSPNGCPWDQKQTLQSIAPYTLEETCELLDAIAEDDDAAIAEELGDVLLQVVLDAQIAADESRFGLTDVVRGICEKMIRRHPHVFADETAATTTDVRKLWGEIKQREKPERDSVLDGVANSLPQLARAVRISARAAAAGYDFPDRRMLFAKLEEELRELSTEFFGQTVPESIEPDVNTAESSDAPLSGDVHQRATDELGDVLFVVANIARRWGINPEEALRRSNQKFARRFRGIEAAVRSSGRALQDVSLAEMEAIYQTNKRSEGTSCSGKSGE